MEERLEEPKRRNPFSVIADSLNEIQERRGRTRKVVWAACALVEAEGEDTLIETLEELPQKQTITNLEAKNQKLKEEVKRLKEELKDEKEANATTATKLSESLELVRKMEGVAQQPAKILNKAKLFDECLAKNPVTAAKVISVLQIDALHVPEPNTAPTPTTLGSASTSELHLQPQSQHRPFT